MYRHAAIFALAAFAVVSFGQESKVTLHVGDPAPPLVIAKWAKGQPVTQLGHGKINVVEFWATWCPPCRESIPHLTELAKKYGDQASFIGVDSFERDSNAATCYPAVEKFVAGMGDKMNYHVAIDGVEHTMGKTWMDAAGQDGIPTAFVVDRAGKVAWIGHPMMGLDEVVGKVINGTFDAKAEAEKASMAQAEAEKAQAPQIAAQQKLMALAGPFMAAKQAKKYPDEVAAIDKAMDKMVAIQPLAKPSLQVERFMALSQYDQAAAEKYASELAAGPLKGNAPMLNQLAWTMVEENSPFKHPTISIALKIAKSAAVASNYDPTISDTLALAFYRANMVSDALSTQKAAVAKASAIKEFDAATLDDMKGRLKMYSGAIKPSN